VEVEGEEGTAGDLAPSEIASLGFGGGGDRQVQRDRIDPPDGLHRAGEESVELGDPERLLDRRQGAGRRDPEVLRSAHGPTVRL
jgi:hypothetical protein